MTISFNKITQQLPNYQAALTKFTDAAHEGKEKEVLDDLYATAMETLGTDLQAALSNSNKSELEKMFDARASNKSMTAKEIKFFNELKTDVGLKTEKILPEETIDEIFDELKTDHPLLSIINFKNAGLRLKALLAETEGTAVWGEIYGEIKGQLDSAFKEEPFSQNKLTAFVVVPKDALDFGPKWIKQFVMDQIEESFAVALETAIVTGDGKNQPIGLMKDLDKGDATDGVITYPTDKAAAADLSAVTPETAPKLLAPVMKVLATKQKTKTALKIDGQVHMLINPQDYYDIEAKFTTLNAAGVYVFNLPFGIKADQSVAVKQGTAVIFVANRYNAYVGGGTTIKEFDQTLAIEDLQLYVAKSYYYGKAKDNNVAQVVTLSTPK
ncbi:phage major capsid protein [Lactococcus lactis]|uniref:phage major capsid protein n=1 Tax=Lactococcus lactis TaxID=1358 RepID=UPI0021A61630|nr:phage major capsid protein [Lactococcus lactis]MCT2920670.1 phage major capsid protein [Lactococcus lactis]